MALSILDGNQSAATLSSVVTGGEHIVAHSVVSLGSNAISNIATAVSGSTVCVGNLGLLQSTVATEGLSASGSFIKIGGHTGTSTTGNIVHVSAVGALRVDGSVYTQPVSIASVTIGNTVTIAGTVTANPTGTQTIAGSVTIGSALPAGTNRIGVVTIGNIQRDGDGVQTSLLTEAGSGYLLNRSYLAEGTANIGVVTIGNIRRAGDAVLSQLTTEAGSGYLLTRSTLNAGSEQIGSVTASISGTVPISISSVTVGNSVTIGSIPPIQWSNANGGNAPTTVNQNAPLPVQLYTGAVPSSVTIGATIANSVTIGSLPLIAGTVTANVAGQYFDSSTGDTAQLANPVYYDGEIFRVSPSHPLPVALASGFNFGTSVTANTFALQGTAVTTSNFTSTTASTVLANYNATREVLTIFNEGAGNLHICAGATCTTIAYQVRLSAGDYYEVPNHQTTITHSAVFATAGTARVTQVS